MRMFPTGSISRVTVNRNASRSDMQARRFFSMLGARVVAGRSFVPEEDRAGSAPVVLLSHRLWQSRYGGDPQVVGRTVTLDNHSYTIAGILPAGFQLLRWADMWMPLGQFDDDLTEHVHHAFVAIARLKPGVTFAASERGNPSAQRAIGNRLPDRAQEFWRPGPEVAGSIGGKTAEYTVGSVRGGRAGLADCVREYCEPAAGAKRGARAGSGGSNGAGGKPVAARSGNC